MSFLDPKPLTPAALDSAAAALAGNPASALAGELSATYATPATVNAAVAPKIDAAEAQRKFVPSITLSSYYGNYGNGNDQAAFEAAFDHAKQLGGARVVVPSGYNPVVQQLVAFRGLELCSNGYFQTFGRDGNVSRIIQASGVNDATVVFDNDVLTQYGATRPFIGPLAIHDLVFSKPAGAGGHHIAVRTQDGREAKVQDFTTFERLGFRGGNGSGFYANGGSPIRINKFAGIGLGGYVVELVDFHRDTTHGDIHQVSIVDVSGDACMGYATDGYGATVLIKGTMGHTIQTLRDIKSEYRVRYPSDGGDPAETPQRKKQRYAIGTLVVGATTPPNLMGQSQLLAAEAAQPPRLCGSVSGQTDLPSSIANTSVSDTTIQIYAALAP